MLSILTNLLLAWKANTNLSPVVILPADLTTLVIRKNFLLCTTVQSFVMVRSPRMYFLTQISGLPRSMCCFTMNGTCTSFSHSSIPSQENPSSAILSLHESNTLWAMARKGA